MFRRRINQSRTHVHRIAVGRSQSLPHPNGLVPAFFRTRGLTTFLAAFVVGVAGSLWTTAGIELPQSSTDTDGFSSGGSTDECVRMVSNTSKRAASNERGVR